VLPVLVRVTAFGALVVFSIWFPKSTEVGFIEKDSGGLIVTVASSDFDESTTDLAVTVRVAGSGTVAGAVYFPVVSIVPQLAPEQPGPATFHAKSWPPSAENCWP
jgi:hypothetical protein